MGFVLIPKCSNAFMVHPVFYLRKQGGCTKRNENSQNQRQMRLCIKISIIQKELDMIDVTATPQKKERIIKCRHKYIDM